MNSYLDLSTIIGSEKSVSLPNNIQPSSYRLNNRPSTSTHPLPHLHSVTTYTCKHLHPQNTKTSLNGKKKKKQQQEKREQQPDHSTCFCMYCHRHCADYRLFSDQIKVYEKHKNDLGSTYKDIPGNDVEKARRLAALHIISYFISIKKTKVLLLSTIIFTSVS